MTKRKLFDEELILQCDCQEPRCLVQILFDNTDKHGPELIFDFEYWHGNLWNRIKRAFQIIFRGSEEQRADVFLQGWDNMHEFVDFAERCLMHRNDNPPSVSELFGDKEFPKVD